MKARPRRRHAFTLIELLVVILIIGLVSIAVIPAALPALSHRQVSESARLVQATIEGARDAAIRANAPRGVRFLPDPVLAGGPSGTNAILAYNRIVPIEPAPDYSEGKVTAWIGAHPGAAIAPYPGTTLPYPAGVLRIEESRRTEVRQPDGTLVYTPNARTNWFWNVRVGDRIRIGSSGMLYTIVGPVTVANPEQFVNIGAPGTVNPWTRTNGSLSEDVEFLYLVNGQDDNANGYVDEGWDGVDNDAANGVDDIGEWAGLNPEQEAWLGPEAAGLTINQPYTIRRRPVPTQGARVVELPSDVVIDLTTWDSTRERSRLPVDLNTRTVEVMIAPNGQVIPTTLYSSPSSASVVPFLHLWLAERADVLAPTIPPATAPAGTPRLPMPDGMIAGATAVLKGERRLITINTRSGNVSTSEIEVFDAANVNAPYFEAQSGVRSAK